jgi:uncharacterized cupredoxin-like copper-binding protein
MLPQAPTALLTGWLIACGGLICGGPAVSRAEQHQSGVIKKNPNRAERPYGREGDPRKIDRTIRIEMSDAMRYFPDQVRVKRGATIRFALRNNGESAHEMVIGTMDELKKDAELVKTHGETPRDAPNVAYVTAGGTGRMVWQFTRSGEFYYGCLIPGHFDAGMIGTIVVR